MTASKLVEALDALKTLQTFVFAGVGVAALVQWRRRPSRASAWLAVTFGVLGLVVVAGQFLPETSHDPTIVWARKVMLAVLVLFPYCLYRFMTSLIRQKPWIGMLAIALTAAVALGAFVLPNDLPQAGDPRPVSLQVYVAALLVQWVLLSAIVAVRLWRAGRGQPGVARRRMRTMSLGAAGLAIALVVGAEFPGGGWVALLVQVLALAAAFLMLAGFAAPRFLRGAWRRREEAALSEAVRSLMAATTTPAVASTLLPHARMLVGASAALLEDAGGEVIASDGPDEVVRPAIEPARPDATATDGDHGGSLVRVPMTSGRLTVLASSMTPFFDDEEITSLEGLAALADLALSRNQLLDTQQRFARLVESSDDAIVATSLDGIVEGWNSGAQKIYGYSSEEVLGRPYSMLVAPDVETDAPAMLDVVRRGESIESLETKRRTKEGRTIDVSLTVSPIRDAAGRIAGASTIARDISDRKAMERDREAAREEADRANQAKSEFLSRMSHELRTPLNAVLGFAQLLEMDSQTAEQREGAEEIVKAGRHLLELIDEVLDIARIEAGRLRLSLEPVDAAHAVEECMSLLTPLADQEGVELILEKQEVPNQSVHVVADRQRLKQVLLNLVSNGIKYNRQNGRVLVAFKRTEGDRRLEIQVTDTGHGIPRARMEQLFAPFERLGVEGSGVEGTGLGLALSKALVEAMGGTISVASELGRGSTFSVELSLAGESPISTEDESSSHEDAVAVLGGPASRRILYIEDNLSNLKLIERLVARRLGVVLMSAMQGGLGITLARDHLPDLILLDLNLPDISGEEVLARLSSDPRTAEIPVVVISADATKGQVGKVLDAGARDYLTKPIDIGRFFEVLDEFCAEPPSAALG